MKRKKQLIALLILFFIVGLSFLLGRLLQEEEIAVVVQTQIVSPGTLEKSISVMGVVAPLEETLVRAPVSEVVTGLFIEEGEYVEEGDLLYMLGDRELRLTIKETKLQLLQARRDLMDLESSKDVREEEERLGLQRELTQVERAQENIERLKAERDREELRFEHQIHALERDLLRARENLEDAESLYFSQAISHQEVRDLENRILDLQQELNNRREERDLYFDVIFPQQERSAALDLRQAQENVEEVTFNLSRGRITQEDLHVQRARVEQLEERLAFLEDDLAKTNIYSPVSGQVFSLLVEEGDLVSKSQPLLEIFTGDSFKIEASLDEMDMGSIRRGQEVRITSEVYPREMAHGRIDWIAPRARQQGNIALFDVEVMVLEREAFLRLGMFVDLEIITAAGEDLLVLPVQSLRRVNGHETLFLVENNRVVQKDVITGIETLSQVEIKEGLIEGDEVITGSFAILQTLVDGMDVRVLERDGEDAN